ncbi:UBAP1-MVB12-associated (UMA)-domain containing protein 1 isoform X2 [Pristis pectinata]|nr:UBAP1-MVB12-associated (UMA)-domain containing protein 1 isoform X2 [Pristis pectinata]
MLNLFGIRKNTEPSKKIIIPEKEVDGFIMLGETANERQVLQAREPGNQATNICSQTTQGQTANLYPVCTDEPSTAEQMNQTLKGFGISAELLSDVPFTLAPHILAIHGGFQDLPASLLKNMNENLASFGYDFTLENSVLHNS